MLPWPLISRPPAPLYNCYKKDLFPLGREHLKARSEDLPPLYPLDLALDRVYSRCSIMAPQRMEERMNEVVDQHVSPDCSTEDIEGLDVSSRSEEEFEQWIPILLLTPGTSHCAFSAIQSSQQPNAVPLSPAHMRQPRLREARG